jgi:hypothetical protein
VRAAGDFPTRVVEMVPGDARSSLEDFPLSTRFVSVQTVGEGAPAGALLALGGEPLERDDWLLPLLESCPLGDPVARVTDGTALAAVPGGGLLYVGGDDSSDAAQSSALWLEPGATLARQVPGGMLLRRSHATATAVDGGVLVAGGASERRGTAHDTYERYDLSSGRFDPAFSARLSGPRRDHGAIALADGSVLLVGGREDDVGAALNSAERIAAGGGNATPLEAELQDARLRPQLSRLADGSVLVFGGHDAQGRVVPSVERLDLDQQRFHQVYALPVSDVQAYAALTAGRIAVLACESDAFCTLRLLWQKPGADAPQLTDDVLGADAALLYDLAEVRAVGLDDGNLLVLARAAAGASPRRAFVIDTSDGSVVQAPVSRLPDAIVELDGGVLAEVDGFGTSLRRIALDSPLHDPAPPLIDNALSFDRPGQLVRGAGVVSSMSGVDGRVRVSRARYADFTLELEVDGPATLELIGASTSRAVIDGGVVRVDDCELDAGLGTIRLARRGESLQAGGASCPLPGLQERVQVAIVLEGRVALSALELRRE